MKRGRRMPKEGDPVGYARRLQKGEGSSEGYPQSAVSILHNPEVSGVEIRLYSKVKVS